jgi:hypothetical protein
LVFQDAVIFQLRAQEVQLQLADLSTYLVSIVIHQDIAAKPNKKLVMEPLLELTLVTVQKLLLPPQAGLVTLQQYLLLTLNIIATPLLATSLTQLPTAVIPLPV